MRGCAGPARTAALVGLGLVTFLILGLALVGRTLRRVLD
jgi:hypothetical protein